MSLPPLPAADEQSQRSPNFLNALQIICDIYYTANNVVSTGNINVHRAIYHRDAITTTVIPILFDFEGSAEQEGIPNEWIRGVTHMFAALLVQLHEAEQGARGT
jgi:hypothetical protein